MTKSEAVFENNDYKVVVQPSMHMEKALDCYAVVNKNTGVTEAESTILPNAISHAKQFSDGLRELSDIVVAPDVPVIATH